MTEQLESVSCSKLSLWGTAINQNDEKALTPLGESLALSMGDAGEEQQHKMKILLTPKNNTQYNVMEPTITNISVIQTPKWLWILL